MTSQLFTPEAQRDRYVWVSVLLAHFAIGVGGTAIAGYWLAVTGYLAFEVTQAIVSRQWLWWDMALDAVAVILGVVLAVALIGHDPGLAIASICVILTMGVFGWIKRK